MSRYTSEMGQCPEPRDVQPVRELARDVRLVGSAGVFFDGRKREHAQLYMLYRIDLVPSQRIGERMSALP